MTQRDLDAKVARVFATPEGKDLIRALSNRADLTFFLAEVAGSIRRERERWRTGSLTPS